jgi:hypothetical protein
MGRIPAGNNLTIDTDTEHWRLLANGDGSERVLVEASVGQPLRYVPTFGSRRRLPETGALPLDYIQRVVLGWSVKDESWHLGLMLEPELAQARGSRWCEVAHWPDPQRQQYGALAREAGNSLAQAITRPFDMIPPREDALPIPPPMPSLPVTLDLWRLEQIGPSVLQFTRSGAWARARLLRIVWYLLWTIIYVVLAVTTLQATIALPKPEWLPYLGLFSALVLVGLIFNHLFALLFQPNVILVDASARTIRALRGKSERWRLTRDQVQAIYVSHMVSRKAKRGRRTIHYGEINLHQRNGKFRFLFDNTQAEEKSVAPEESGSAEEHVTPLTTFNTETNMQAAAIHVARALDVPAWYDQRVK